MPDKPNIIFILTDDQGPWAMGCAGNTEIKSPNLDRIAATGIRFTDFFCVSPVCSPARASIVTGRIPSAHGVHDWLRYGNSQVEQWGAVAGDNKGGPQSGELVEYLKGMSAYTEYLAEAGYVCGLSGKWHMGDAPHPQKGHTFWEVHAKGGGPYYKAPMLHDGEVYFEERYVTDHITDNALKFLEERAGASEPFYLGVHYTAPHSPWSRENHPKEVWDDYFENCPFESTPKGLAMQPWFAGTGLHKCAESDEKRRRSLAGYFTAITEMDRNVGRILDYLEEKGLREDTLIVFTGDNGMNMGHHGVWGKGNGTMPMNMYDEAVKVPMMMSHPCRLPAGKVCDAMLSHYDVFPTLLDYAGISNPEAGRLPGKSFVRVLEGEADGARDEVIVFDEYGPVRMVRTREWKYVHRCIYEPHELYNLLEDPGETTNLYGKDGMEEITLSLKAKLDSFFLEYSDPALDGTTLPVNGSGQRWLVGPSGKDRAPFVAR